MIKPNPFTPKSGLEPKVFINRQDEIDLFNVYLRRLVNKGILKSPRRGEYIINDRMLWEYIQAK